MRVHLVAVQAALRESAYASAEAFSAWIGRLAEEAAAAAPQDGAAVLLAFPEAIAMPLLITLGAPDRVAGSGDLVQAARRAFAGRWREVAVAAWRHHAFGPAALHLSQALAVHGAYVGAFRRAARAAAATVVAGSAFLPDVEMEAARGAHVVGRRVYNVAYTFTPSGALLGRSRKVFLTRGLESRAGLSRGRVDDLAVLQAPCGAIAVAVCLDGWYESVVAALDAGGARVLVQPSANDASWTRPWPHDADLSEGEAWLERGLRALLQGRVNLRYAVNPMLVGEAFGFAPRGRSTILANARAVRHNWVEGREGVLAIAPTADHEATVVATVELPDRADEVVQGQGSDGRMPP